MTEAPSNCDSLAQDLSLLAAGCLDAGASARLQGHLAVCPECRQLARELELLCGTLSASAPTVSSAIVERILPDRQFPALAAPREGEHASGQMSPGQHRAGQRGLVAILATTAALLVLAGLRNPGSPGPHDTPPHVAAQPVEADQTTAAATLPPLTWISLRSAAAESDEALDSLLSHSSPSLNSGSPLTPFSWQESL